VRTDNTVRFWRIIVLSLVPHKNGFLVVTEGPSRDDAFSISSDSEAKGEEALDLTCIPSVGESK